VPVGHLNRDRGALRERAQRSGWSELLQDRWIDAMGERAKLFQRPERVRLGRIELLREVFTVG
jgi:hypothetical protein